ncbi:MAG: hypothetical protein ACRYG2_15775 [Janthinobacterium lividum]
MFGRAQRRRIIAALTGVLLVLGLLVQAPAASAAGPTTTSTSKCWYRGSFGGQHYCPADVEGLIATRYGVGRRVWLRVIVLDVGSDGVLVGQQRGPFCDQGTCDFAVSGTNVGWSGTHRPAPGAVVNLFGTTTSEGLTVAGYVFTGMCEDPYRSPC